MCSRVPLSAQDRTPAESGRGEAPWGLAPVLMSPLTSPLERPTNCGLGIPALCWPGSPSIPAQLMVDGGGEGSENLGIGPSCSHQGGRGTEHSSIRPRTSSLLWSRPGD